MLIHIQSCLGFNVLKEFMVQSLPHVIAFSFPAFCTGTALIYSSHLFHVLHISRFYIFIVLFKPVVLANAVVVEGQLSRNPVDVHS